MFIESENSLGLKGLQRQKPCRWQRHLPLDQVAKNPIQPGPEILDMLE